MKHIIFGVAYSIVASLIILQIAGSGWGLPGTLTPPTDWPMTAKSRAEFQPSYADLKHAATYFTP